MKLGIDNNIQNTALPELEKTRAANPAPVMPSATPAPQQAGASLQFGARKGAGRFAGYANSRPMNASTIPAALRAGINPNAPRVGTVPSTASLHHPASLYPGFIAPHIAPNHVGNGANTAPVHHPAALLPGHLQHAQRKRTYVPITARNYANHGTLGAGNVASTDFARDAANQLFDEHGRLNTQFADHIAADLMANPHISEHHKENALNTLTTLSTNHELRSIIDGICENKPLRGPAADLVRATLNLPPEHSHLSKADARKAVVMSLMGNLRQGKVGSCFATSLAIQRHEDAELKLTVAHEFKTLLEENKMVVNNGNSTVDIPLNRRTSRAHADVELIVHPDGTCYGKAVAPNYQAPHKLHETPGMEAALRAMGIPEHEMENTMLIALGQMRLNQPGRNPTSRRIIEHIAHTTPGAQPPQHRIASALNAFSGREDARLLRAWEYTLATKAEIQGGMHHMERMTQGMLFGAPIAGRPDLAALNQVSHHFQLSMQGHFPSINLGQVNQELFNDVHTLMQKRFFMQYDADIPQNSTSADGVSNRGGFVLYDRTPPNDPSKWVRIDNPAIFQRAMQHLVNHAASVTSSRLGMVPGTPEQQQARQAGLQQLAWNLNSHVGQPGFLEHAALQTHPPKPGEQPYVDISRAENLPWKDVRGGIGYGLNTSYGSTKTLSANLGDEAASPAHGAFVNMPHLAGDASRVIGFLGNCMGQLTPEMRNKAASNGPEFKTLLTNNSHAFSLMAGSMKEIWQHGWTTDQWVQETLKKPALQHLNMQRSSPPLFTLLQNMGKQIGANPAQIQTMYQRVSQGNNFRQGQQFYSLARVHQELLEFSRYYSNTDQLRSAGEEVLSQMAPPPAKVIADTNWGDDNGNARYMGTSFNVYKGMVEMQFMNKAGGDRQATGGKWLTGNWSVSAPMTARVGA